MLILILAGRRPGSRQPSVGCGCGSSVGWVLRAFGMMTRATSIRVLVNVSPGIREVLIFFSVTAPLLSGSLGLSFSELQAESRGFSYHSGSSFLQLPLHPGRRGKAAGLPGYLRTHSSSDGRERLPSFEVFVPAGPRCRRGCCCCCDSGRMAWELGCERTENKEAQNFPYSEHREPPFLLLRLHAEGFLCSVCAQASLLHVEHLSLD